MALGVGMGAAIGAAVGNVGRWTAMGAPIGVAIWGAAALIGLHKQ